jgi:antitoxin FitA
MIGAGAGGGATGGGGGGASGTGSGGLDAGVDGQTRVRRLALWRQWRHNGAMPSVQIKDVPDDVHRVLRERAARAHQSLQEYLRTRLIADASEPTLEEVFERAAAREGGKVSFNAAVRHVRAERDRR